MKIQNKERQMRPICCRSGVTDRLRSYEGKEDVKKGWIQGWGAQIALHTILVPQPVLLINSTEKSAPHLNLWRLIY